MSEIKVANLSVAFTQYHDGGPSLKEWFASVATWKKPARRSQFLALNDISLTINDGERVGIVGHNGAGKSTFLKTLCRIYEPSGGDLHVKGDIAPLLEIGAGFNPEFTGRENIYLNGTILGFSKKQLKAVEKEVIDFADIEEFIDTPVKYYSTGMYMRLAFSVATTIHPDILILDEIFAGGDATFVQKAKKRLHEVIDKANIMILVSHDPSIIRSLCNRVIWLDHGRLKLDGGTEDVLSQYLDWRADLG